MPSEESLVFKQAGNSAFQKGDNEEAVKQFTLAIEADASNHVFFSNRSAAYAGLHKFDEALKDAEECIRLNPTWPKGYSRQGLALFNLHQIPESKSAYESGLKLDPNNVALKEGLKQVEEASRPSPANPFASMFGPDIWMKIQTNPQLSPYLKDDDFVAKVKMLQSNPNSITTLMTDPRIQKLLGVVLGMPSGTFDGASGDRREENDAAANMNIHTDSDDEDMPDLTTNSSSTPMAPEPELSPEEKCKADAVAKKMLGNTAYKKRDFDEALKLYAEAQTMDPTNAIFWLNTAAVRMELGCFEESIADSRKALDVCREHGGGFDIMGKAYARIGTAQAKMGLIDEAICSYDKSLVESNDRLVSKKLKELKNKQKEQQKLDYLDNDKALEEKEQGNLFFREGKWVDAVGKYTESLRRNPNDHKVYSNRAACYTKLMDWPNAMKDAEKCMEIDPTFVKAYIRKAKIEFFLKKYHCAVETYQAGLALDSSSQELKDGLTQVQMAIAQSNYSGEIDPERRQRALEDPEVQKILGDPQMNTILQSMQDNPATAQKAMKDPAIRAKIQVLINAGVLQMR